METLLELEPRLRSEQARAEAARCLQCFDAPCARACPAGIVIPRFIRMIRTENYAGAAEVVRAANPLAQSCGVACPDEQLCGAACVRVFLDRPVEIRRLHRFVTEVGEGKGLRMRPAIGTSTTSTADLASRSAMRPLTNPAMVQGKMSAGRAKNSAGAAKKTSGRAKKVAIIGAGPAGLSCAFELRRAGVKVTVFEARDRVGGVLSRTIPAYRFPSECVGRDARWALGAPGEIDLRLRRPVLDPLLLRREFAAVFVAIGLSETMPPWEGEDLRGVIGAGEFLERTRAGGYRTAIGRQVAVIGGGNVALDAAMAAVRCGQVQGVRPSVHLLYRRTRCEMPAWEREVALAEQVGVLLHFLVVPSRFVGEGRRLRGIELFRTRLEPPAGDPGAKSSVTPAGDERPGATVSPEIDRRAEVVIVPDSGFHFACDQAVVATGQSVAAVYRSRLPRTRDGYLRPRGRSLELQDGIFVGGDAAGGDQNIVSAVRQGKTAARSMLEFLGGVRPRGDRRPRETERS